MTEGLCLEQILFADDVETREEVQATQGAIPESIQGTYYLNGPANFRRGGMTYQHWLDGDGLIRALRFAPGLVEHQARFVRSKKFTDETAAGRPLYRAFGTAFQGDRLRRRMTLESPVNVSVYRFGEHLLAFGEQSLPCELSPENLETIGECNFNGQLLDIAPFSAHPKIDARTGRLCNFGLKYTTGGTNLCYWEFDRRLACVFAAEFEAGLPYSVHDFALSQRFAAFYLSPYLLDIGAFVRERRSIFDAAVWCPDEENKVLLVDRRSKGNAIRLGLGRRGYCLHLINAFDDGDILVLDLIETEEPLYLQYRPLPHLFSTVKPCAFVRIRVHVSKASVAAVTERRQDLHLDFPVVLPEICGAPYGEVWTLAMPTEPGGGSKFYDRIVRFDWNRAKVVDHYLAPSGVFLAGEPALVRHGLNKEAFMICPRWHSRANCSDYIILDPFNLSSPPVATLPLTHASPLGFHSTFCTAPHRSAPSERNFNLDGQGE